MNRMNGVLATLLRIVLSLLNKSTFSMYANPSNVATKGHKISSTFVCSSTSFVSRSAKARCRMGSAVGKCSGCCCKI
uniref:Putative secreted protein n=1 Tax=Anopheles triannulatus TaxID=58253 RepID=A0A2M4B6J5_9DIPT